MHAHFLHWFAIFVEMVGGFHNSAVIVIGVMLVITLISIFVFYKIFEHDLFDQHRDD